MTNWLSAVMDPLKSAGETAKGLVELRDTVKFGNAIVELQAQIMAAQQGAFAAQAREAALAEEIGGLKKRVTELEAWEAEKQRYKLNQVGDRRAFVYSLKEGVEPPEPPHQLCANCYNQGQKSILQGESLSVGRAQVLVCHRCGDQIYLSGLRYAEHGGARRKR